METDEMGRALTEARIENLSDVFDAEQRRLDDAEVRRIVVENALVDTGATRLSLPTRFIQQPGLRKSGSKGVTSETDGGDLNAAATSIGIPVDNPNTHL